MSLSASASFLWWIPVILLSVFVAWYFYRNNDWLQSQKKWIRRILPTLRAIAIFCILTLLLDIVFLNTQSDQEKPIVLTLIDVSKSMTHFKDSASIQNNAKRLIDQVKERFSDKYELAFYTIGSQLKNSQDLNFNAQKSNHELAFKSLSEQYLNRNTGALIFVSDGNYNVGDSPTYAAEQLSLTPIYTLGVGDTTPKKDQSIQNLYYNDIVFLKDEFPIEVDIETFKIKNTTAKLTLRSNGKTLATKTIRYTNNNYHFIQENFKVIANKVGFQPYTISIEYLAGEFSRYNNTKTCYIEVIDSRNELCFVSNSPHPDVSALRSVAESNENYHCTYYTPKQALEKNIKPDLLIWNDPGNQFDEAFYNQIERNKIPVLFVIAPNTSSQVITKLKRFSTSNSRNQTDETQGRYNSGFTAFDLPDEIKGEMDFYPPLVTKFGAINPVGSSEILMYQRIGNAVKSDPLLYFGKNSQQTPYGVIYGEGVWRWKIQDYVKHQNHERFNTLFSKCFSYLLVKQYGMGLTVQFDKKFSKYDRIGVNANFYNASLEPITSPEINLNLTDQRGKKYLSKFNVSGNGYYLDLGTLPPGTYNWTANTQYQKKKYVKKGFFVVEDISLEFSSNVANHGLLKQLSKNSGGNFNLLKNFSRTLDRIEKRDDIAIIEHETTLFQNLIDSGFLLFLILLCLSTEWFIKRYFGAI